MQNKKLEVLFSPAEFQQLAHRDLSRATCVVFDILRATSSIVTALANGARSIMPVSTIAEALAASHRDPEVLLAGERDGFRITAGQTGGIDFNLGNSPREFVRDKVSSRAIVITTTNGSRALRSCAHARKVIAGSFLNLQTVASACKDAEQLVVICSGTYEEASFEDTLAAGAIADIVWHQFAPAEIADSAQIARLIYLGAKDNLIAAMQFARNGRRLLEIPDLRDDVAFCFQRDIYPNVLPIGHGEILLNQAVDGRVA